MLDEDDDCEDVSHVNLESQISFCEPMIPFEPLYEVDQEGVFVSDFAKEFQMLAQREFEKGRANITRDIQKQKE